MTQAEPVLGPSQGALRWTWLAVSVQFCLAAGTAVMAAQGLALRCEGFGCIGEGIFWAFWAMLYGLSVMVSTWARSRAVRHHVLPGAARAVEGLQWLMGAALAVKWAMASIA